MKQFFIPLILAVVLCTGAVLLSRSSPPLPELGKVSTFQFENADGGTFGSENLAGKISIWSFFFTSCQGPCPATQAVVAKLQRELKSVPELQLVSISIDPKEDSPEKLVAYRSKLGGDAINWRMLRPGADSTPLDLFAAQSFHVGVDLKELIHSTRLVLIDGNGTVRGSYNSESADSLEELKSAIRSLQS